MITSKASIISASLHAVKDKLYIQGFSITTDGLRIHDGPVFKAPMDDVQAIGTAVINALNTCKEGIPHPDYRDKPKEESVLVAMTGKKSENQLMKSSLAVNIYLKNQNIELRPMRFNGPTGPERGYKSIKDKIITTEVDPQSIGEGVIKALEAAENPWIKEK